MLHRTRTRTRTRNSLSFDHPDLLWLAVVLPVLVSAAVYGYVRRRRRAARLLGSTEVLERLGAGDLGRFTTERLALVGVAALALGLAAAGPRWGFESVEERTSSAQIVLALDVSKSMLARDLAPNRLERERVLAKRLIRELPGDRMGLVAFAGRAYVLSPVTADHAALHLYLDALDPDIVSQGGSSLASALRQASDLARSQDEQAQSGAVVLVSDGEALEERDAVLAAAQRAAQLGVVVHTVGVGTADGAPIPDATATGAGGDGYKRGPDGEVVVSRLDRTLLEEISRTTGGRYVDLDAAGATNRILSALQGLDRTTMLGENRVVRKARFGWFVALALLLLAVDAVLARRSTLRPGRGRWPGRLESGATGEA